jgi:hypothetical protein
MISEVLA